MTVARKAGPNGTRPDGSNRYCQRKVRKMKVARRGEQRDEHAPWVRMRQLPPDGRQVGLPQEERDERHGDEQDAEVLEVARHSQVGCSGGTVL